MSELKRYWTWDYEIHELGSWPTRPPYAGHNEPVEIMKAADVAALPPAMTWTRETPTKPGWYFIKREQEDARVVQVIALKSGNLLACFAEVKDNYVNRVFVDDPLFISWYWAGPMEPPQ